MPKLVLDTNTLVSAFFWKGNEHKLLKKIEQGEAQLFISKEILYEVEAVVNREKFKEIIEETNQKPDAIIQKIISLSLLIIGPELSIKVCRDPRDNKILECDVNAKADYIVSGDEDLLSLKCYSNIKIIKSSEIINLV
ncbi:putative toxin-antitoxin system toxin component, PIN family [Candidatus Woesearchaeota archaeon]|nr:putative toxin-antitoxin system toxin component, PIN family [Candidatus Woesearchaeota archaeon]